MWTRKIVKEKGKRSFLGNFWKCILVALIAGAIAGGSASFSASTPSFSNDNYGSGNSAFESVESISDLKDIDADDIISEIKDSVPSIPTGAAVVAGLMISVIVLFISLISIAIKVLLINPVSFGCDGFFRKNLDEPASLRNIISPFEHGYKNVVKTAFLKNLFVYLWSLLFVIPGIIKSYEYRMIPYILSENPDMDSKAVFEESKRLMKGNKWRAFVLDLSFIGWNILSLLTCGILGVFYVNPYRHSTNAALYEALKYGIAA